MKFADEAIVLSSSKFSEDSVVITLFCKEHGLYRGLVKAHHSKTKRGIFMEGNIIEIEWQARLAEHLGNLKGELLKPVAANLFNESIKLLCLRSAISLILEAIPEREPHQNFYNEFRHFLEILISDEPNWLAYYVFFELALIRELGFAVDLSECAATGSIENLIYVSPKSGRAVSAEAGEPYKNKLLSLPRFILSKAGVDLSKNDIADGFKLTGFFLDKCLQEIKGRDIPKSREIFTSST